MKIEDGVAHFLEHLRTERRYSPHTLKNYARDLSGLVQATGGSVLMDDVDNLSIRQRVADMHRTGLGGRSIQRWLSAVRSCFRYGQRQRWCRHNPAEGVRTPKAAHTLPKAMDVDEMSQLLDVRGDADTSWLGIRNRAIFELLYSSGMRISELCGLDIYDLSFDDASLRVTGKGNKTRQLPVGRQALAAVRSWLAVRPEKAADHSGNALFISSRGGRVSARSIQKQLRDWGIRQGINAPVSPHTLRHSFASHMLESSGDLRAVQELLGHASISTTQVYTHLDYQHLTKVYDQTHPRAGRISSTRDRVRSEDETDST